MDLNEEEFEFIETYCLPDSKGKVNPRIRLKSMCGFTWKQLSQNFKDGVFTLERSEEVISIPSQAANLDILD